MAYGESNGHLTHDVTWPKGTVGYPSDSLASWLLPTRDIFLWQNWHHVAKSTEFPRWV